MARFRPVPVTPEERRQVIALAREGKTYKAITEATGRPKGTIASIMSKAILDGELRYRGYRDVRRTK